MTTFAGDTGSPLTFTLQAPDRFGVVRPINCSGFSSANFVLHLYNPTGPTTINCTGGMWLVVDGPSGVVQYTPIASEINTPATYTIYFQVITPAGPKTMQTDTLIINPIH